METLLAPCEGNPSVPSGFLSQRPVTLSFLWSASEQTVEQTIGTPVIYDAIELIMTHYKAKWRLHLVIPYKDYKIYYIFIFASIELPRTSFYHVFQIGWFKFAVLYMYVAHMLFDRNMTLMLPFICNGSNSMEILLYHFPVHGQYIATIVGHTATGQLLYHL